MVGRRVEETEAAATAEATVEVVRAEAATGAVEMAAAGMEAEETVEVVRAVAATVAAAMVAAAAGGGARVEAAMVGRVGTGHTSRCIEWLRHAGPRRVQGR